MKKKIKSRRTPLVQVGYQHQTEHFFIAQRAKDGTYERKCLSVRIHQYTRCIDGSFSEAQIDQIGKALEAAYEQGIADLQKHLRALLAIP